MCVLTHHFANMPSESRRKFLDHGAITNPELADEQHEFCAKLIDNVLEWEVAEPFDKPVLEKWEASAVPGYAEQILRPMDFSTIRSTLRKRAGYRNKRTNLFDYRLFLKDVHLIFDNCFAYNSEGSDLNEIADQCENDIHKKMKSMPMPLEKKNETRIKRHASSPHDKEYYKGEEDEEKDDDDDDDDNDGERVRKSRKTLDEDYDEIEAKRNFDMEDRIPRKSKKDKDRKKEKTAVAVRAKVEDEIVEQDEPRTQVRKANGVAAKLSRSSSKERGESSEYTTVKRYYEKMKVERRILREDLENLEAKRMKLVEDMSDEKLMEFRDKIEKSNLSRHEEVVKVLHEAVGKAVEDGDERDPETVTIQLEEVSPRLLMEVHYLFHPDPERDEHRKKLTVLTQKIASSKARFKSLKRTHSGSSGLGDSKKAKHRR